MLRISALSLVIAASLSPLSAQASRFSKAVSHASGQVSNAVHKGTDAVKVAANQAVEVAKVAANQTSAEANRASVRAVDEAKREGADVAAAAVVAADQTQTQANRTSEQVVAELKREGEDLAVAVKESGYYADREQRGFRDQVMSLESNVRNGELDHLAGFRFYRWKDQSDHAAQGMQKSAVLRAIGQVAATAGGPAGSAGFSAWYTYTATGDIESALRVGAVTLGSSMAVAEISGAGAGSDANGEVIQVPRSMSPEAMVARSLATGAVGATAAVALGAKGHEVERAFVLGALASAATDYYEETTGKPLDSRPSEKDALCKRAPMTTPQASCAAPPEAYVEVSPGVSKVDVRTLSPRINHVGLEVSSRDNSWALRNLVGEGSPLMTAVSKVPGGNGMAFFHDIVADGLAPVWLVISIHPATELTYLATGAQLNIELADTVINNQ
jgi:hypothetical protein